MNSEWAASFARWLTPRRLRSQAVLLAVCLWGVCAADYGTRGLLDRAGNIKFQDSLPFYISARLITGHRATQLYDANTRDHELRSIVGEPGRLRLVNLYGPQAGLLFLPLARFRFLTAGFLWAAGSLIVYFACAYAVWRCLPNLQAHRTMVIIAALAFAPLFHLFVRGQISALILLCFTVTFLAFRNERKWWAGVALGCLILKPQFLVAIPIVLLMSQSWSTLAGLVLSATAQLALACLTFGSPLMRAYFNLLLHPSIWVGTAELSLAPIQMHSLRAFWLLLIPWRGISFMLYLVSSAIVILLAVIVWRSRSALAIRYSALIFTAVLVNPHLFVYDLVALAPALLMLTDWALDQQGSVRPALVVLLYLSFVLPLVGPLSRWTHVQFSVIAFVALLGVLYRVATRNEALACRESLVV